MHVRVQCLGRRQNENIKTQRVSFIASLNSAALSHRESTSTATPRDSSRALQYVKRNSLYVDSHSVTIQLAITVQ